MGSEKWKGRTQKFFGGLSKPPRIFNISSCVESWRAEGVQRDRTFRQAPCIRGITFIGPIRRPLCSHVASSSFSLFFFFW